MDRDTLALLEAVPEPAGGAGEIAGLIAALVSGDERLQDGAADRLLLLGKPAVLPLLVALRSADTQSCPAIIALLGQMSGSIVPDLCDALTSESTTVRLAAAALLGRARDPRATMALAGALRQDPEAAVRKAAALALGNLGGAGAVLPLAVSLEDRDMAVRCAGIRALGQVRHRSVVPYLIRQLEDDDEEILWNTAEAIRQVQEDARGPLILALREGSHHGRAMAASVLESVGAVPEDPVDRACFLIAKERWYELDALGTAALVPLAELLTEPDTGLRLAAVSTVSRIGGEPALRHLAIALNDNSPLVRKRAGACLAAAGETAETVLRDALASGSLRFPAEVQALLERISPGTDTGAGKTG
jgi:HEAT repeat protein